MSPAETPLEEVVELKESDPAPRWDNGRDDVHGSAKETNAEDVGEYAVGGNGDFDSDTDTAGVDYWEEVALEDGSVCFYNHTSQEYSPALPSRGNETSATGEISSDRASGGGLELPAEWGSGTDVSPERWGGRVWDGVDGDVFVPWPDEKPEDMRYSPEALERSEGQPDAPEEENEEPFTPDDPAIVREQNLRALLVLLPAKLVKNVVKVAMDGAVLHRRRTATADAERRRRSLLSSRAQFRHTMHYPRKLRQGDEGSSRSGENEGDGGETEDEVQTCRTAERELVEAAGTPDSWRKTTTQERDTIVGQKLEEVLQVLYKASTLEARLTMRAINLSSQGIGAAGAQRLAPALKSCVVVYLYLGNNAMGDKGVTLLADGLRHARGLQNLHLNDNEITDVGCHRLASALGPLRVLSTLNLCHNPFGDNACLALARYLSQPECPLRYLSVAGCLEIDPAAWKTIRVRGREGVGWDPPRPGDDGAVSLATALMSPHGCSLRGLRMANAGMRLIGAKAIAAALCANHTLETVDLSGNDFADKAGENAWESASELLSFGLQVNATVHTIVLRACGLTRQQVLAVQQNCCPQTLGTQECQRKTDHGVHLGVKVDGGSGNKSGGARQRGPLPWREEKRLGFRAACLRDWLLDAARIKGMNYPPLALDQGDTASSKTGSQSVKNDTPVVKSPTDAGLHVGGTTSDSYEEQDQNLVGPQLWSGLLALRRLVAWHGSTASLPSRWNSIDGYIDGQTGSCCTSRQTKLLPQEPETDESTVKVASDMGLAECDRNTLFSASNKVRGIDISSRESLLPTQNTSEHDRTCLNLGPRSSASTSARYLDRPRGATMRASASGLSPSSSEGDRPLAASETSINILSTESSRQESEPVSAGDLEAAAAEGQRFATEAANTCKSLDERQDALSRELQLLRLDWDGFSTRATGEASSLELALVDALAARDAARDNLRLLEPVAAAARKSEKAGKMEMEHFAKLRRPECEAVGAPAALINLELLQEDFRDRSQRAQEMAKGLLDARHRVEAAERNVEVLKVAERDLRSRSAAYETAYRKNTAGLTVSVAGLRAKRAALRRIEKSLAALAATMRQLAEAARGEESLRALVPAGSNRRELDLQVADAVRVTTKAARDMEQTRLRRDEAARRLDQARHGVVATEAREDIKQSVGLPAGAADRLQDSRAQATALGPDQDTTKAENVRKHTEAYGEADQDFLDAQGIWESARIKRALGLIKDHNEILLLKEEDASNGRAGLADLGRGGVVEGRPAAKRRPRGDAAPLGVQLNARIDLGAKIALLRGSGEEDENGNLTLPEVDDRFLTAGQRLRRLLDAREVVRKEKHKAYVQHSRQMKKNLRVRKRFTLAEKRAGRMAKTMDTRELVDASKGRGCDVDGSEQTDQLRRIFVEEVRPELHVRLHATSRWTKSTNKRRERMGTLGIGEIVARRQRAMLTKEGGNPPPLVGHSFQPAATA